MSYRKVSAFFSHDLCKLLKGQSANKKNMGEPLYTRTTKIKFQKVGYVYTNLNFLQLSVNDAAETE